MVTKFIGQHFILAPAPTSTPFPALQLVCFSVHLFLSSFFFLSWPFSGRPAGRPHGNLTLQHVRIFPKKKSEEAANKKNIREHGAQNKYFQDKLWAYSLGSVSPAMKCLMGNGKYLNFYKLGGAHKLSVRNSSCGFHGFSFFFPLPFFFRLSGAYFS